MKHKDNTARIRNAILGGVVAILAVVLGVGLFYNGNDAQPYRMLDKPDGSGPVKVVAYFSYTCPHCRTLEELIEDWSDTLPEGTVFKRVPVALSAAGRNLAKGHLALERLAAVEANHMRIFRALHDHNRRFDSLAALADFVDGRGVDRAAFLRAAQSQRVARQMAAGLDEFQTFGLRGVPALVVDDKYVINMDMGRRQALQTARDLAIELVAQRHDEAEPS